MARIPNWDLSQELKALSVQLNLFRMLAHAGTTGGLVLALGAALLSQLELQPNLRELAILQVAHESRADYEWVQHVPLALSASVIQAQIAAIEQGSLPSGVFTDREEQVFSLRKRCTRADFHRRGLTDGVRLCRALRR